MKPYTEFPLPQRGSRCRWRIPPPRATGMEALDGLCILEEVPGAIGGLLWQVHGDVLRWAAATPVARATLFAPAAEHERAAELLIAAPAPELRAPLETLVAIVGRPAAARAERITLACRQLSQWADGQGRLGTSLVFSHAAALASPGDAVAAYTVGRLARRRADYAVAESWLRYAVLLARQRGDWNSYTLALAGLGAMHMQRGNFPAARKMHTRRLRVAQRHGLREMEGGALHDLFLIAIDSGQTDKANVYARAAFQAYGSKHARLPYFAHDVAYFWSNQGYFATALPVFEAVLPYMERDSHRRFVLANVARAAGGIGDRRLFDETWREVWEGGDGEVDEKTAEVLLELARGAAAIGEWDRAEMAAQRSSRLATSRREARIQLAAEAVLESVRHERTAAGRVTSNAASIPRIEEMVSLAGEFVESLNALVAAD